jgi:hypothetical protein
VSSFHNGLNGTDSQTKLSADGLHAVIVALPFLIVELIKAIPDAGVSQFCVSLPNLVYFLGLGQSV